MIAAVGTTNEVKLNSVVLYQNYPNLFNLKTTIKYEIPKTSNIKILLYNSIGKKTIYTGEQSIGSHYIELGGDDMPSGVYISNRSWWLQRSHEMSFLEILEWFGVLVQPDSCLIIACT